MRYVIRLDNLRSGLDSVGRHSTLAARSFDAALNDGAYAPVYSVAELQASSRRILFALNCTERELPMGPYVYGQRNWGTISAKSIEDFRSKVHRIFSRSRESIGEMLIGDLGISVP